ncbi:MAG: DUF2892 domain-containing protein [Planctomycetota bacterium]
MAMQRWIRLIAGSFILVSLALAHFVSAYFLWFTAFVGASLIQSALTKWCLMEKMLAKLGVKGSCEVAGTKPQPDSKQGSGSVK